MRRVRTALVLVFVLLVAVGCAAEVSEAAGLSDTAAGLFSWGFGICTAYAAWRAIRVRRRRRDASRAERDREAGAQLQREDPRRYKAILAESTDALAVLAPDQYVGRHLASKPDPKQKTEKQRRQQSRHSPWHPPSAAQEVGVEELTKELEHATLVRTLDDGTAEVVGLKDYVAYRYRVDTAGVATLVSTDETLRGRGRKAKRVAGTGFLLFAGSVAVTFIVDHSGHMPRWIVPFAIVGFVLAFGGIAANPGPRNFIESGERWHQEGGAWNSD